MRSAGRRWGDQHLSPSLKPETRPHVRVVRIIAPASFVSLVSALAMSTFVPIYIAGQPASYDPTAVRRSALRSATAVSAVAPELASELGRRISALENGPRDARDSEWSEIHVLAYRALVTAQARELDNIQSWAKAERELQRIVQSVKQLDQPWLEPSARHKIGRIVTYERLARQAAARSRFDDAHRIAAPIYDLVGTVEDAHGAVTERFENQTLRRRWDEAARETLRASNNRKATVLIDKWNRRLYLAKSGSIIASWPVDLGKQPLERKLYQGDKATPEGTYLVSRVKDRGASRYYKAFLLDYPNQEDQRRYRDALRNGKTPSKGVGGMIEIHGHGGRGVDWTDGCIAVADPVMDQLFRQVSTGTRVTIVGRLSEGIL